jgi:hypothetical protein
MSAYAKAPARQPSSHSDVRAYQIVGLAGGGGGSRTRVRNRCQPGESMLCPIRLDSLPALKNGQDAPKTSPIDLALAARTEPLKPAY